MLAEPAEGTVCRICLGGSTIYAMNRDVEGDLPMSDAPREEPAPESQGSAASRNAPSSGAVSMHPTTSTSTPATTVSSQAAVFQSVEVPSYPAALAPGQINTIDWAYVSEVRRTEYTISRSRSDSPGDTEPFSRTPSPIREFEKRRAEEWQALREAAGNPRRLTHADQRQDRRDRSPAPSPPPSSKHSKRVDISEVEETLLAQDPDQNDIPDSPTFAARYRRHGRRRFATGAGYEEDPVPNETSEGGIRQYRERSFEFDEGRTTDDEPVIAESSAAGERRRDENISGNDDGRIDAEEPNNSGSSSTRAQRRRPRPVPIYMASDPNIFAAQEQNAQTPTTETGFASLNLNGNAQEMSHDMTAEMQNVPRTIKKEMASYLYSQFSVSHAASALYASNSPGPSHGPAGPTLVPRQSSSAQPVTARAAVQPTRPSKRLKAENASRQEASVPQASVSRTQQQEISSLSSGDDTRRIHWPTPLSRFTSATTDRKRKYDPFIDRSYKRTNKPNFNIYCDGIVNNPDILFHFVLNLPVRDFVSLYAIDKVFHKAVDINHAALILGSAFEKAPESARAFPFRAYGHLAIKDPRFPKSVPSPQTRRKIPSFKWLKMVVWREKVVHEILAIMAEDGCVLPPETSVALKRFWLCMDIPDNARRIGYFHAEKIVTDEDLFYGMWLIIKLDMRFSDPLQPTPVSGDYLRRLVFGQSSLSYLWKVLKGLKLKNDFEVLKEWVRYRYYPANPAHRSMSVFGIPPEKLGRGCLINWGKPIRTKDGRWMTPAPDSKNWLCKVDQLIPREASRRELKIEEYSLQMLTWGYIDITALYEEREEMRKAGTLPPEGRKHPPITPKTTKRLIKEGILPPPVPASEEEAGDDGNNELEEDPNDVPLPMQIHHWPRRIPGLEDEYSDDDEVGAPEVPQDSAARDPLLDFKPQKIKSAFVVQEDRQKLDAVQKEMQRAERQQMHQLLQQYRADCAAEEPRAKDKDKGKGKEKEKYIEDKQFFNPQKYWSVLYPTSEDDLDSTRAQASDEESLIDRFSTDDEEGGYGGHQDDIEDQLNTTGLPLFHLGDDVFGLGGGGGTNSAAPAVTTTTTHTADNNNDIEMYSGFGNGNGNDNADDDDDADIEMGGTGIGTGDAVAVAVAGDDDEWPPAL